RWPACVFPKYIDGIPGVDTKNLASRSRYRRFGYGGANPLSRRRRGWPLPVAGSPECPGDGLHRWRSSWSDWTRAHLEQGPQPAPDLSGLHSVGREPKPVAFASGLLRLHAASSSRNFRKRFDIQPDWRGIELPPYSHPVFARKRLRRRGKQSGSELWQHKAIHYRWLVPARQHVLRGFDQQVLQR